MAVGQVPLAARTYLADLDRCQKTPEGSGLSGWAHSNLVLRGQDTAINYSFYLFVLIVTQPLESCCGGQLIYAGINGCSRADCAYLVITIRIVV